MVMINHESLPALWNFPAEVTHAVLQVEKGPVGLAGDPVYSCPAFVGNARLTLTAETVPSIGIGWKAVLWQPLLTHAAALIAVLIARPGRVRPLNGVQLNPTPHLIVMGTTKWYGSQAFGFPAAVGFSHARRFTGVILHAADLLVKWFERSVFPPITVVRIAERPPGLLCPGLRAQTPPPSSAGALHGRFPIGIRMGRISPRFSHCEKCA